MKIYLLGDEVFNTFQDANQLYGYLSRCVKNPRGKVLVVRNNEKGKFYNLTDQSPAEIFAITLKLMNELR